MAKNLALVHIPKRGSVTRASQRPQEIRGSVLDRETQERRGGPCRLKAAGQSGGSVLSVLDSRNRRDKGVSVETQERGAKKIDTGGIKIAHKKFFKNFRSTKWGPT